MRLDYLDGLDGEDAQNQSVDFRDYDNVDLSDLSSIYDGEEMGNIFKKIRSAVKTAAKKVGDKVGDGIRFVNRYVNPATVLLRNGFLLAMKINLMNVAGKLRYAYLTDAQAQAKGINLNELKKLRTIKDRAETVYWQAGGKKENLKKGILSGKGNKDKKVPLSGFEGVNGFDNVYADEDEYNIIHSNGVDGLGELASGTAIAAATSAVAAIAGALKQVKGLFSKGGNEETAFQSETDNAGTAASAPASIPEDEDAMVSDNSTPTVQTPSSVINKIASVSTIVKSVIPTTSTSTPVTNDATKSYAVPVKATQPVLPSGSSSSGTMLVPGESEAPNDSVQTTDPSQKSGFLETTTSWVKANPGKSLLVAGGVITGSVLLMRAMRGGPTTNGLDGVPTRKKRKAAKKAAKKSVMKVQHLL